MEALKLYHNKRRVERDLYYQFDVSGIELEILTSLGMLILKTGKPGHAKDNILNKASRPRRSGRFIAGFYALLDKGYIIQKKANNGHSSHLTDEGLMILERFDLQLSELAEGESKGSKSINEVLSGILN